MSSWITEWLQIVMSGILSNTDQGFQKTVKIKSYPFQIFPSPEKEHTRPFTEILRFNDLNIPLPLLILKNNFWRGPLYTRWHITHAHTSMRFNISNFWIVSCQSLRTASKSQSGNNWIKVVYFITLPSAHAHLIQFADCYFDWLNQVPSSCTDLYMNKCRFVMGWAITINLLPGCKLYSESFKVSVNTTRNSHRQPLWLDVLAFTSSTLEPLTNSLAFH